MKTKILILNAYLSNKGNDALIRSLTKSIKEHIPDAEFKYMGPDNFNSFEFSVQEQLGWAFNRTKPFYYTIASFFFFMECTIIYVLNKLHLNISPPRKSKLFIYYDNDVIVNSGGDHLSGETGIYFLNTIINIIYGILLRKRVVLCGESLGYFKNTILDTIAKKTFNETDLILVREYMSRRYLENIGVTKPFIAVTADLAFLLDPISKSQVESIFLKEDIPINMKKQLVGINPSSLIGKFVKKGSQTRNVDIADVFAKSIDYIVENMDANVILVPHVYTKNNDDRTSIKAILDKVQNKSEVFAINCEYNSEELKGIISMCDLFVGARMHATIASTSMYIPTVGIAYSHKMYGIIGEMLGQDEYILNINELTYENLILKVNNAFKNSDKIRYELEQKIPLMKERATLNGKYIRDLLCD